MVTIVSNRLYHNPRIDVYGNERNEMLSYNSRIRAANGFLTTLMLATMLFIFIDYNNIMVYVVLLNILVSYQVGHYFATHIQSQNSYIGILSLLFIYLSFFVLRLVL